MIYDHWTKIPSSKWQSRFFKPNEIACRGTGQILVNEEALAALDDFRSLVGGPVNLSSAYRSPYHNACVGGAPRSSHLQGHAFDVRLEGRDKQMLKDIAKRCGFRGFGMNYNSFLHIDRAARRSW